MLLQWKNAVFVYCNSVRILCSQPLENSHVLKVIARYQMVTCRYITLFIFSTSLSFTLCCFLKVNDEWHVFSCLLSNWQNIIEEQRLAIYISVQKQASQWRIEVNRPSLKKCIRYTCNAVICHTTVLFMVLYPNKDDKKIDYMSKSVYFLIENMWNKVVIERYLISDCMIKLLMNLL